MPDLDRPGLPSSSTALRTLPTAAEGVTRGRAPLMRRVRQGRPPSPVGQPPPKAAFFESRPWPDVARRPGSSSTLIAASSAVAVWVGAPAAAGAARSHEVLSRLRLAHRRAPHWSGRSVARSAVAPAMSRTSLVTRSDGIAQLSAGAGRTRSRGARRPRRRPSSSQTHADAPDIVSRVAGRVRPKHRREPIGGADEAPFSCPDLAVNHCE